MRKKIEARFIYVVRVAESKEDLGNERSLRCKWWFLGQSDPATGPVSMLVFDSFRDAKKTIKEEEKIIQKKRKQLKRDITFLKKQGFDKRYGGIIQYIKSKTDRYGRSKKLYFQIQPIAKEEWDKCWKGQCSKTKKG